MISQTVSIGALGEAVVARYLQEGGYMLIDRNYRKPWGEIDLIMTKEGIVHFFEVKTVSQENQMRPEENLHEAKLQRVLKAARSFVEEHQITSLWQIDAALVRLDRESRQAHVEVLENLSI